MENKEYLNEESYQKSNGKVKKAGKILLIIGIIVLVVSFIIIVLGFVGVGNTASNAASSIEKDFFNNSTDINSFSSSADTMFKDTTSSAFKNVGLLAFGGVMNALGFILTIAGTIFLLIAHRREITAYTVQQTMPIAKEGIEKMTPTIANSVGSIAESITKGIQNGKNNQE